jgi:FdhE protein
VVGIEGDAGAAKAETCGDCRTYAKMLYQAEDMRIDAFADDLETLGLNLLAADACLSCHAPNPLVSIGKG